MTQVLMDPDESILSAQTPSPALNSPAGPPSVTRAVGPVVLAAKALSMKFGSTAVLSDVNVEFRRGSVTALIGPTGSGKSTFLRTLNRMNDRVPGFNHRGDVTLDGRSIFSSDIDLLDLRRRVGMVFQRPNPFPMSIAENVVAGVRAHRLARRHELGGLTERYLTEVGLLAAVSGRLNKSPFQLSGGQQQLLCLARALAVEPEVLLLDEPTSSLDPVTTEEIEELLCRLAPDRTLVIVTHNLAQARRVADHVVFFHQGRMVEYGPTAQVFEAPTQLETQRYVTGRMG